MAKFIRHRERVEVVSYLRSFDYEGEVNWGFAFPCDEHGNVDVASMGECAIDSYNKCLSGTIVTRDRIRGEKKAIPKKIIDKGVQTITHHYYEPGEIECNCGKDTVVLHGFTNTCETCNRDYNMSGQELAPREFWGEETGESLSDILSIDVNDSEDLLK